VNETGVSMAEAWRRFIETGEVSPAVRAEVGESWVRSRKAGVDPKMPRLPHVPSDEIKRRLTESGEFLAMMQKPVARLQKNLAGSGVMIGLFDLDGCQLECAGDPELVQFAAGLGFGKGAILGEARSGTSSVAMALASRKPMACAASEHYCLVLHHIAGAATPIFDASARMQGIIALCADATSRPRHLLALLIEVVRDVMGEERVKPSLDWLKRYRAVVSDLFGASSDPLVVVNEHGYIRSITPAAAKLLDITSLRELDLPVDRIARFTPPLSESLASGDANAVQVKVETAQKGFVSRVEFLPLVDPGGRSQGSLVIFHESRSFRREKPGERTAGPRYTFDQIVGKSPALVRAKQQAVRAAATSVNVLLEGDSGTGKEMFAQAIHNASDRREGPFIAVNCAAIPSELIESELFGYRDGAFTGAKKGGMVGKFEAADGGTIFLDEICEMPLPMQSEILRVLENRCITRVGEYGEVPIDIRVIAATNKKVLEEVEKGNFREDLYYRLSVAKITVPSLSENKEDIPALVDSFIAQFNQEMGRKVKKVAKAVLERFMVYDWPGNVRELKNAIEHAVMAATGDVIGWEHLPDELRESLLYYRGPVRNGRGTLLAKRQGIVKTERSLEDGSRQLYLKALELANGNKSEAARLLGMGRATFYRKLSELGLGPVSRAADALREEKNAVEESSRNLYLRALKMAGGNATHAAKLLQIGRATFYRKLAEYRITKREIAAVRRETRMASHL